LGGKVTRVAGSSFDYRRSDIHQDYDAGRSIEPEARTLWVDDLRSRVGQPEPCRVLDLGCGTGRFTDLIKEAFPRAFVIGADPARGMLDEARPKARLAAFELLRAQAESLPFTGNHLDLVVLSLVYHHLDNPAVALAGVARILRPSGFVYIRSPTVETMKSCPWDSFFPTARRIAAQILPTTERVLAETRDSGLVVDGYHTIRFLFARSGQQLIDRIARRAISSLRQVPADEFEAGFAALETHCLRKAAQEPIYEELQIFVLRRP
jgi:ubiquinone/menaquinone biosynthesis C-methylase UbiE